MQRITRLLVATGALGAVALPALPALAAPDGAAAAAHVASAQQVQVVGRGAHLVPADEYAAMRGEYRLADGRLLSVGGGRTRPVAELDGAAPVRLVAVGPNQYASADGSMVLHFAGRANGNVDAVTVTLQSGTH
ncbi:MAG: hypothetical protein U1F53_02765 [Burkholderiaceae bacterium]